MEKYLKEAKAAATVLATLKGEKKNAVLRQIADALEAQSGRIIESNRKPFAVTLRRIEKFGSNDRKHSIPFYRQYQAAKFFSARHAFTRQLWQSQTGGASSRLKLL